jgi:hypothetical protein
MMPPRDYSALTSPVTPSDVAGLKRQLAESGGRAPHKRLSWTIFIVAAVIVWFVLDIPTGAGDVTWSTRSPVAWGVVVVIIAAIIIAAIGLTRVVENRAWERYIRLTRFATANGLVYTPDGSGKGYPGLLFSIGRGQQFTGTFSRTDAPAFDIGNFRYRTGSGKNQKTHNRGYVAMRLERKLPHMVLDAVGNNGLFGASTLPLAFGRDQILSLEGDFDKYFTLYCPREYERDALYVFTPDLMALLIDNAATLDVEIVDDWLFVYSMRPFGLEEPGGLEPLFGVIDTIGAKTLSQTDRYRDDRAAERDSTDATRTDSSSPWANDRGANVTAAPGDVAPEGRRLGRRTPLVTILAFVGVAIAMYALFAPALSDG